LLASVGQAVFKRSVAGSWYVDEEPAVPDEQLIVVSQTCDIESPRELCIEAMPCFWCPQEAREYQAARIGNSHRFFFLRERPSRDGDSEAFIVDATRRVQIDKEALLDISPNDALSDDRDLERRFRAWLGGRYSRPALDPPVVKSVVRPLVTGISRLKPGEEGYDAIALVREIRMGWLAGAPPFDVNLLVIVEDEALCDDERNAAFTGRLEIWLKNSDGVRRVASCDVCSPSTLSVGEYEQTIRVPLDHFTVRGESTSGAHPVEGIDHG